MVKNRSAETVQSGQKSGSSSGACIVKGEEVRQEDELWQISPGEAQVGEVKLPFGSACGLWFKEIKRAEDGSDKQNKKHVYIYHN